MFPHIFGKTNAILLKISIFAAENIIAKKNEEKTV